MAIQTYDTHTLLGVIENLPPVRTPWLERYFGAVQTFDTEFIDFDVVSKGRPLAPFVVPTAQGKPMRQRGYSTKRFKPAYIKPKDLVDPRRVLKRRPGEKYAGSMSPSERRDAIVADILRDHEEARIRRMEWMAINAIVNDQVIIEGEDYPRTIVEFGRDANLTVTLTDTAQWGETGVSIVDNIEAWAKLVQRASGRPVTDVILGLDAWEIFRKDAEVKDLLDTEIAGNNSSLSRGPVNDDGLQFRGQLNGVFNIFTYSDIYQDEDGAEQEMMDPKKVVLTSPSGIDGTRCFGAILDPGADYVATEVWPKNFVTQDPPGEWVMSQSAPLMVPARPNGALVAKVLE